MIFLLRLPIGAVNHLTKSLEKNTRAINMILEIHKMQEIKTKNGKFLHLSCVECMGDIYPCLTVQIILEETS